MSEIKIGAWRKNFAPDETGFQNKLKTRDEHWRYLTENGIANYLKKVDYPEYAGCSKKESFAKDYGCSASNLFYVFKRHPEDFINTVRGFIYYKHNRKVVRRDKAKVKGEELN